MLITDNNTMLFLIVLALGWVTLTTAGDSCNMLKTKFCNCTEYDVQVTNDIRYLNNAYPLESDIEYLGAENIHEAVAVTTLPKIRDPNRQTIVECNLGNAKGFDSSSLESLALSLQRKWVDKLHIENIPVKKEMVVVRFPSLWLKEARIKQFEVERSNLAGDFIWNGNPFVGQDHTLIWFAAVDCSLTGSLTYDTLGTVNTRGLDELPRLEGLDFSKNRLVSIQKSAFGHTHPRLKTIVLSKNIIQEVSPEAFSNLRKLQHIDLSDNAIENISREIFNKEPSTLRRINLSSNRLKTLPKDIFSNMPGLRVVDVSYNFLYSMPEKPWNSVWWQLQMIDVSENFIECDCDLLWLVSNSTLMKKVVPKRRIKGHCLRTFSSLLTRHYEMANLTKDQLDCKGDDDEDEDDYDYFDRNMFL